MYVSVHFPGLTPPAAMTWQDSDLIAAIPTANDEEVTEVAGSLILLMDIAVGSYKSFIFDAERGPQVSRLRTRTLAQKLASHAAPFKAWIRQQERRENRAYASIARGNPPGAIYLASHYYYSNPLNGGTLWLAGHYIDALTINNGLMHLTVRVGRMYWQFTISVPGLSDAAAQARLNFAYQVGQTVSPLIQAGLALLAAGTISDVEQSKARYALPSLLHSGKATGLTQAITALLLDNETGILGIIREHADGVNATDLVKELSDLLAS